MTNYSAYTAFLPAQVNNLSRALADKNYVLAREIMDDINYRMASVEIWLNVADGTVRDKPIDNLPSSLN